MAPLPPPRSPGRSLLQQAAPGRQTPSGPLHGPWAAAAGKADRFRKALGPDGTHEPKEKEHRPRSKGWRPPGVPNSEWVWGLASLRHSGLEGGRRLRAATNHCRHCPSITVPLSPHTRARRRLGKTPVIKRRAPGLAHSRPSMKGCFSSLHCLPRTCYSQGQMGGGGKRRPGKGGVVSAASMRALKPTSAFRTGTRRSRRRLENQTLSSRMSAEPSPAPSSLFNGQNPHQSLCQAPAPARRPALDQGESPDGPGGPGTGSVPRPRPPAPPGFNRFSPEPKLGRSFIPGAERAGPVRPEPLVRSLPSP